MGTSGGVRGWTWALSSSNWSLRRAVGHWRFEFLCNQLSGSGQLRECSVSVMRGCRGSADVTTHPSDPGSARCLCLSSVISCLLLQTWVFYWLSAGSVCNPFNWCFKVLRHSSHLRLPPAALLTSAVIRLSWLQKQVKTTQFNSAHSFGLIESALM